MKIKILLFAGLRERAGKSELTLDVPAGTKVADLVKQLFPDSAWTAKLKRSLLFAVNQVYADRGTIIKDGDEVALIPPVAGG